MATVAPFNRILHQLSYHKSALIPMENPHFPIVFLMVPPNDSVPEADSNHVPSPTVSTSRAEDQRFDLLSTGQLQNINSGGNPDGILQQTRNFLPI